MYIWLALVIPVVAIIFMYIFFKKKIAWWEASSIFLIILVFIAIMKYGTEVSQTNDVEYIQDYIVKVEHFDEWDEWVTQTCTRQCCCTRNSKGEETCGTETYDCSYRRYNPEYWQITTASGNVYNTSKEMYDRLMVQFKTTPSFVDMNRDFYTIDGDMQYFEWNRVVESVECIITSHTYENRIQASHSVLNFPTVDTSYIRFYQLKEYPQIYNYTASALLGYRNDNIDRYINQSNALYASSKQVKVFYLVFKNQPLDAALKQEQYWKGGNKNEVNICIGIDNDNNIKWSYVFSWTKENDVKIKIRDYINEQKNIADSSFINIINYSNKEIVDKFERRHFKEFSYLTVEPTKSAVVWTYIISLILTIGMCVWAVMNEFDSNGINYKRKY